MLQTLTEIIEYFEWHPYIIIIFLFQPLNIII